MSWNNFTRVDIISSKSLKELYLSHNKIGQLYIENNYPSLTKLELIDNRIEKLDFTMFNMPCLEYLNVGIQIVIQKTTK
jgi:Leucine-rich repeat (LRR) protein